MSLFTRDQYSRKATKDVRDAAATALARYLRTLKFDSGVQFTAVHDSWPSYSQRYQPPSACVLPNSWKYGPWGTAPKLLEWSWEPQGEQGFGLEKTSELEMELEISIATNSPEERAILLLGVEDAFIDPQGLMSEQRGPRNAILLPMPEYYGLSARFNLLGGRVNDDQETAMREKRDAVITVSCQASKVRLIPVFPLALTIETRVNGDPV